MTALQSVSLESIKDAIADRHLLNHPFYRAWMQGELTREQLQRYTVQYFPHVAAFPRFVSAIHSHCEDEASRKALFANLSEEEGQGQDADHPELWLRFAEGLGISRAQVRDAAIGPKAQALADVYFQLCRSSFAEGLGALIAYEAQVPEIAEAKIDGLKRHYGIEDARSTAFFETHKTADQFHSESCALMLRKLSTEDQKKGLAAARKASDALWDFLTEVHGVGTSQAA